MDPFSWSPDQWGAVMRDTPWTVIAIIAAFSLGGVVFSIAASLVKMSPAPAEESAGRDSQDKTEQIIENSNTIVATNAQSSAGNVASVAGAGRVDQSTRVTLNMAENSKVIFAGVDKSAKVADLSNVVADDKIKSVKLFVLWGQKLSWRFNGTAYDREALDDFLGTSAYQNSLDTADAIICVGLASNWATSDGQESLNEQPETQQLEVERQTDHRAFQLCKDLSEAASRTRIDQQFFGVGLGFHTVMTERSTDDKAQRSLVLLHVETVDGSVVSRKNMGSLIATIMNQTAIEEFEGLEYSRVVNGKNICWSLTSHGEIDQEQLDCI